MLYVQYNAEVMIGNMDEYHQLMVKFLTMVEKYGADALGAWRTAVGKREEVTTLERYRDMAHFEESRGKLEKDPQAQELLSGIRNIRTISSKFMTPASYSHMQ